MTETTLNGAVQDYLRSALVLLDDLPADQRDELAESVEQAILEVAAESEGDLVEVLGDPSLFVTELRTASGLEPAGKRRKGLRAGLERTTRDLLEHRAWRWVMSLLGDLRPAWWVARAFALLWLIAEMAQPLQSVSWLGPLPVPAVTGPLLVEVLLLGAAIYGSVEIGRSSQVGWKRLAVVAVNVVAAIAVVVAGLTASLRLAGGSPVGLVALADQPVERVAWVHGPEQPAIPIQSVDELEQLVGTVGDIAPVTVVGADGTVYELSRLTDVFDDPHVILQVP